MVHRVNTFVMTTSHCLSGISWWINFSFSCVCWNSRYVGHFFYGIQYLHLCLSNILVYVLAVSSFWFPYAYYVVYLTPIFVSSLDISIHLPFSIIPLITALSSLNVQHDLITCGTSFLLSGQPLMIHSLSCSMLGHLWLLCFVCIMQACHLEWLLLYALLLCIL